MTFPRILMFLFTIPEDFVSVSKQTLIYMSKQSIETNNSGY